MYTVNVAGKSLSAPSFVAATKAVRTLAYQAAETINQTSPANYRRMYRSPKVASREAANAVRRAERIAIASVDGKLPSKAGSHTGKLASLNWSIQRI